MTAVDYLEARGVPEAVWPNFRGWVRWFEQRGLMGVVTRREDGEIVGVALARCLPSGAAPSHYWHEETGEDVFVDTCACGASSDLSHASGSKDHLKSLLTILFDRFGRRRTIQFNRGNQRKAYDYDHFMRKALA